MILRGVEMYILSFEGHRRLNTLILVALMSHPILQSLGDWVGDNAQTLALALASG